MPCIRSHRPLRIYVHRVRCIDTFRLNMYQKNNWPSGGQRRDKKLSMRLWQGWEVSYFSRRRRVWHKPAQPPRQHFARHCRNTHRLPAHNNNIATHVLYFAAFNISILPFSVPTIRFHIRTRVIILCNILFYFFQVSNYWVGLSYKTQYKTQQKKIISKL